MANSSAMALEITIIFINCFLGAFDDRHSSTRPSWIGSSDKLKSQAHTRSPRRRGASPLGTQLLLVFEDATKETLFDRHRNVLAAELAHRIKNSLQVISSFVSYELRRATDPVRGRQSRHAGTRISAVAELYDMFEARG